MGVKHKKLESDLKEYLKTFLNIIINVNQQSKNFDIRFVIEYSTNGIILVGLFTRKVSMRTVVSYC